MKRKISETHALYVILLLLPIFIFFSPVWLKGKLPIPADTIVGLYHPFRDMVWKEFTAGVPFKNFLITDAVRQQYPWRELAIDLVKGGELPLWNPYTHAGTPLLANIQTALFYPFNVLFFILPFTSAWTIQVISQPVLLAIFTFAYLVNIGISKKAAVIASLSLAFSGFSVVWLEWNTTLHTLVWLPLALLAIEKILNKESLRWYIALGFSLTSILFAGFLQTAFYAFACIGFYGMFRVHKSYRREFDRKKQLLLRFSLLAIIVVAITSVQWLPTARLVLNSARAYDQGNVLQREDWFLPWQHLVQFIAPDFFGNPSTLNYWGVFNYMEFVGYIGIVPLTFAFLGMMKIRPLSSQGRTLKQFFLVTLLIALVFSTPNPISKLPFQLKIPLLSTAQPSRLMMLVDFSLAVLAAFGVDAFLKSIGKNREKTRANSKTLRNIGIVVAGLVVVLMGLWAATFLAQNMWPAITKENIAVTQRNLILPTLLTLTTVVVISVAIATRLLTVRGKIASLVPTLIFVILFSITSADLLRFAWKFTPFSDPDFLYPSTATIEFLKSDKIPWRYMTTDRRIFPPNFSVPYRLQTIEGYDPIYISRFGQLIASAQRGEAVLEPIPFHRIIRPDNVESPVYDLLNVKYVLSLNDLTHPKLEKVFQEGETRVYRNNLAFPRAFLVTNYTLPETDHEALEQVFALTKEDIQDVAKILEYTENAVRIAVESDSGGMLVLADTYFPGWTATLDGVPTPVERVLYALRGTMIPPGTHEVLYRYSQL
ncbi:YfhO family protein [Patescibacteria group bacterium]|nr:YfhO family protein [Patescibacteria group bacterium]